MTTDSLLMTIDDHYLHAEEARTLLMTTDDW